MTTSTAAVKMTIKQKRQWIETQFVTDRYVELALLAIFRRQTADEQRAGQTAYENGMGFTGVDAEFGTSLANAILRYGKLTQGQMFHARKIIRKYWKQLIEVATVKGKAPWCVKNAPEAVQSPPSPKCIKCGQTCAFENDDGDPCCNACILS